MSDQALHTLKDEELMAIFKYSRDQAVFTELYQRYFQTLCKNLIWLGATPKVAEDIVQNVFLKVFRQPISFDTSKRFKTWLFVLAKNKWYNEIRDHKNREKYTQLASSFLYNSNSHQENTQALKEITIAIQELSDTHREVLSLKYSSNLTIKEISEVLDCSTGTVKSRLFYAIQHLKKQLRVK